VRGRLGGANKNTLAPRMLTEEASMFSAECGKKYELADEEIDG
jgi:hypothetical protein